MSVVKFLLNQGFSVPPLAHEIQAHKLEGWLYSKLEPEYPIRKALRPIVLARAAQQSLVRQHFASLLTIWAEVGLHPMVFKGFALSEFVYPNSFERSYGDIDVLFSLEEAKIAVDLATKVGWLESCRMDDEALGYDHEFSHLFTSDRTVRIDVHLELLQTDAFSSKRVQFTKTISENAMRVELLGNPMWIPQPVDHVIAFLINRRWADRWKRKASDYTDLLVLKEHSNITREAVLAQAQALGCLQNVLLALETCDPWLQKLDLTAPSRFQTLKWDILCASELGSYEFDYYFNRLRNAPSRISYLWQSLLLLLQTTKARDNSSDLNLLVAEFDMQSESKAQVGKLIKWCVGVKFASRILRLQKNPCVPKSLALLKALSRDGFAASFVSGVRKVNGKLEGHAWVEVDGLPLELMGDIQSPSLFKENFRYDNYLLRQRKATPAQKV